MYSEIRGLWGEGWDCKVEDHAADWIGLVRLYIER